MLRRLVRSSAPLGAGLLFALSLATPILAGEPADAAAYPAAALPAPHGGDVSLADLRGEQATLLVFLSVECPISAAYAPALNELAAAHAAPGVRVAGLFPNSGESLKRIAAHAEAYALGFPVLKDPGGAIARELGVTVCPEACLFDAAGRLVYRGRIDDRFVKRGGAALEIKSRDLAEALAQTLRGEPVAAPRTEAVGCPLETPASEPDAAGEITYAGHVAAILRRHCQECHRDGGVGPFPLTSFEESRRWAADIAAFTASGAMPPWHEQGTPGRFQNERRMPPEEVDLLAAWVDAGCPAGDLALAPPPLEVSDGWRLGEPDAVLTPPEDYTLAAEGVDEYRCFVLPTAFDGDRYVKTIEVRPGNARVVHHVLVFLDSSGRARQLDAADPAPGYATSGGSPGFLPVGSLGGWAPGNLRHPLPAGIARHLPAGVDVVLQVHYHRTGKPEPDRTQIGLHFAREPIERLTDSFLLAPITGLGPRLQIPAGEPRHEVRTAARLPKDVLAVAVTPHMHLLGREMKLTATLPDGTVETLFDVRAWDFNWQESYEFREPLRLPEGTRLDLFAAYDNSEANPYNPHRPPQLVSWGPKTSDEMCLAFLEFTPVAKAASPEELKPSTVEDRLRFALAARQLDGAPIDEASLKWLMVILEQLRQQQAEGSPAGAEGP